QRGNLVGNLTLRLRYTFPCRIYGFMKLPGENGHLICFMRQTHFDGVEICNKISDLIGELWITCQVITHGWLMARTHFLNITSSNALHDIFLFSIHDAMLFLAQAHSAISRKRLAACYVQ